jgi:ATP-dependent Clp protease ATP-binding subunit ClpA
VHRGETVLPLGPRLPTIYPFERFSELAKKVLTNAQQEAERAHHSYIGTEHLLVGLLREPDGLGAKALAGLGVHLDEVRRTIESVLSRNEKIIIQQIIPTSQVKKVIELAFLEARKESSDSVGTEHLLLGLMVEGTSVAPHVLNDLGVSESKVRTEVERLRAGGDVETRAPAAHRFFEFGSRVLVHDREPPHRLWEGRISSHDGHHFRVEIPDHPEGGSFLVEFERLHPVPMLTSLGCAFCQAS